MSALNDFESIVENLSMSKSGQSEFLTKYFIVQATLKLMQKRNKFSVNVLIIFCFFIIENTIISQKKTFLFLAFIKKIYQKKLAPFATNC